MELSRIWMRNWRFDKEIFGTIALNNIETDVFLNYVCGRLNKCFHQSNSYKSLFALNHFLFPFVKPKTSFTKIENVYWKKIVHFWLFGKKLHWLLLLLVPHAFNVNRKAESTLLGEFEFNVSMSKCLLKAKLRVSKDINYSNQSLRFHEC